MNSRSLSRLAIAALAVLFVTGAGGAPASADDDDGGKGYRGGYHGPGWLHDQKAEGRWADQHRRQAHRTHGPQPDVRRHPHWRHGHAQWHGRHGQHGKTVYLPVYRTRHYRDVIVIRRHGPLYPGYGHHRHDDDAYRWLAFTAITLKILDNLNEAEARAHEQAQIEATRAQVGETIVWNQAGASGRVSVLRDGYSTDGRYCREFQHVVIIGGRSERAYGTACQQPDGAWQIVATG